MSDTNPGVKEKNARGKKKGLALLRGWYYKKYLTQKDLITLVEVILKCLTLLYRTKLVSY